MGNGHPTLHAPLAGAALLLAGLALTFTAPARAEAPLPGEPAWVEPTVASTVASTVAGAPVEAAPSKDAALTVVEVADVPKPPTTALVMTTVAKSCRPHPSPAAWIVTRRLGQAMPG